MHARAMAFTFGIMRAKTNTNKLSTKAKAKKNKKLERRIGLQFIAQQFTQKNDGENGAVVVCRLQSYSLVSNFIGPTCT